MKRNFHLIGEVNTHEIEHLIEYLVVYDEIDDVIFNEQFRDLEVYSNYKDVDEILEHCIDDLNLNLRFVERKAQQENSFEKRYFLFKNFDQPEAQVFLKSYLENDPTVKFTSFNAVENILTVDTSDPFIYNKISYVIKGMDDTTEVEELFSEKKFISFRFLTTMLVIALFVMFAALTLVTIKNPTMVTEIGWIGMYGILITYFAEKYYDRVKAKRYFSYPLVVIVTTFTMLAMDYHIQAIVGVGVAIWLDLLYKEVVVRIKERLVDDSNSLVTTVKKVTENGIEEVDVVSITTEDVVSYSTGDLIHYDGIVQEGNAKLDTCFMSGIQELQEVVSTQQVSSGSKVIDGSITVKVTGNYYQSALYRLYRFNPKELKQHGYLEVKRAKSDRLFAMIMVLVGIVVMVAGVLLSDFGQHHFIVSGLAVMYLCYPLGMLSLRPVLFQIFKQVALKKGVVFLNEDSLNRFLELADTNQLNFNNDSLMKFHKGGYNVADIVKENTIIYRNESELMQCEKIANRIHITLSSNKKILWGSKIILSVLCIASVISFNIAVGLHLIINLMIIFRTNRIINMML